MSESIEKEFSRNIFGKKEPQPKGEEDDEDELPSIERTEEELIEKTYPEELEKITELARKAGFGEIVVTQEKGKDISLKNPNVVFFPKIYLDNYREATKYIKVDDINSGLLFKLFDLKNYFKQPEKQEILDKISARRDKLEKLENEIKKANKNEIVEKTSERGKLQKEIDSLDKLLRMDFRKKFSESEIKELSLRYNIMDILNFGIENSFGVRAAVLKKLREEEKISSDEEYNQRLSDEALPEIRDISDRHPFLDKESRQKLIKRGFETAEKIGETFLQKKEEEKKKEGEKKKYDDFRMYG